MQCCEPVLQDARRAVTAEALMRSRYTAFVKHDADHLFRTWHPRTRPSEVTVSPMISWHGLEIVGTVAGLAADTDGEVEFRAHFADPNGPDVLHERSRFARRAGRWMYVEPIGPDAG